MAKGVMAERERDREGERDGKREKEGEKAREREAGGRERERFIFFES